MLASPCDPPSLRSGWCAVRSAGGDSSSFGEEESPTTRPRASVIARPVIASALHDEHAVHEQLDHARGQPTASTVSVPARVLISSVSFAASECRMPIVAARPLTLTPPASPLTVIVSSPFVALTTMRSAAPSPVSRPGWPRDRR